MVSTTVAAAAQDESTPASTTASHASSHHHSSSSSSDELLAPTTDSSLYIIDELNRAVPGLEVHNSLEDSFLPPPTAASLVGSPPGLSGGEAEGSESRTLSPGFKVRPRGHSAPVIISQVPVKSFQSSSQKVTEPMPDKHTGPSSNNNHNHQHSHHSSHQDHHHNHHHPHDLSTADSQVRIYDL